MCRRVQGEQVLCLLPLCWLSRELSLAQPQISNRTIDARWSKSYSLPGLWMLRRLTGGWHTIELTLLPFQQDRRASDDVSDALLSQRLPGKFKVLELTSC